MKKSAKKTLMDILTSPSDVVGVSSDIVGNGVATGLGGAMVGGALGALLGVSVEAGNVIRSKKRPDYVGGASRGMGLGAILGFGAGAAYGGVLGGTNSVRSRMGAN